ncbi:MAG: diaminopropionate ammonia-lyase [Solirubrobacteraceae bacterium]|nr:diaminopropionate ammonia-lyase [Solirubrobacteraceae bacterium]
MRALVNPAADRAAVPAALTDAAGFHIAMAGYRPTRMRDLSSVARELGLERVALKDESDRFGLPAFKVLGASWAIERTLREHPETHTLVAASAGNHGRAVAHVARSRELACRVYLPQRSAPARRAAIAAEGAEVVVVAGDYEEAVARAAAEGAQPGVVELADVGAGGPAAWVIDGYATLFAEAAAQGTYDVVLVPAGVGSLAAAAARFGAQLESAVVAVEPVTAACVTASLAAGRPTAIANPGTTMAGLDCAAVSMAAWPSLLTGLTGAITVTDAEAHAAMRELAAEGLAIGDCGAAPLAALRALAAGEETAALREAVGLGPDSRVLLIGTEGVTDAESYRSVVG